MTHFAWISPPPHSYPNYLTAPHPERRRMSAEYVVLAVLLVLCFIPRALVAWHIPCIAGDGVHYVKAATALEAHDYRGALWEGGFNLYPIILMLLHRIGLDWELAANLWGLTISCLVVLPLWGWVRRQFDDHTALAACLLYAIHPKFISESPELMRDPTFWFFFTLGLYALWRAVTEVRYDFFLTAGAAITLASFTRIEGLFLLIPLVLWTFWRWLALKSDRRKLIFGALVCVAAFPLLLALANVIFLPGSSDWSLMRLSPLARVRPWVESVLGFGTPAVGPEGNSPPSVGQIVWRFFPTMARGLSPAFALLMFAGLWEWRRTWARRDNQALFLTTLVMLGGVWIQSWSSWYLKGNINARYALPIVLMASPFAALALRIALSRVWEKAENLGCGLRGRMAWIACVAVLVVAPGAANVLQHSWVNYSERRMMNQVGCWLWRQAPAPPSIVGPWNIVIPITYYSRGKSYASYRYEDSNEMILETIAEKKADVVLVQPFRELTPERCESLVDSIVRMGFTPVHSEALAKTGEDCRILVRTEWLASAKKSNPNF